MYLEETLSFDDCSYKIAVVEGNHGGWLFVSRDGKTIYEQSGYRSWDKAISDGKLIAEYDHKNLNKEE